jgi:hypothetical protein
MTFRTVVGRCEGLGSIMASEAEFAVLMVRLCYFIRAFLHLKEAGMAVLALESFVCMNLAVKFDRLSRRDSPRSPDQTRTLRAP